MGKEWFIADPHFGHANIMKYEKRPFIDTEHMDNTIIENYNKVVSEDDIVFWLGDMFFCKSDRMEYISNWVSKGRNILIRGNHDKGVSDCKFKRLGFLPNRMLLWKGLLLTHEPVSEDNMNHLASVGVKKNVHGHVHSEIEGFDKSKYFCVSVENINYTPIDLVRVLAGFQIK